MSRVFESPLPNHPGRIEFPEVMLGRHYKAFLKASDIQTGEDVDSLPIFAYWHAARALAENLDLNGIGFDDDPDQVPLSVLNWVREATSDYVMEQLNPKNSQEPSGTT